MNEKEKRSELMSAFAPTNGIAYAEPLDPIELVFVLLQHSAAICICAVIGAIAAFSYTYFRVPATYQATAKLYMVSTSKDSVINLSDLQMGSQLMGDCKELIKGRTIMRATLEGMGLDWSVGKLSSAISISSPSNTRILCISATTTDPQLSADIANQVAIQTMEWLPRIMSCDAPNIAEVAEVPKGKQGPNYTGNTMKGGIAGAILAIGYFFLLFQLNDSLVSPDDVARYLQLDTLAVVPENTEVKKNKQSVHRRRPKHKQDRHQTQNHQIEAGTRMDGRV